MKKSLVFAVTLISIIFLTNGCRKDSGGNTPPPADPCTTLAFKFAADVQVIFNTSCATSPSCHASGSNNSGGPLTDYNLIFAKRSNIKFQIENGFMPKGGSLTADKKNKIICWINRKFVDSKTCITQTRLKKSCHCYW